MCCYLTERAWISWMKTKENINKARGNTSSLLLPPHKHIKEAVNQKLLLTLYRQYAQNFLKISKIYFVFIIGNHKELPAHCQRAPIFFLYHYFILLEKRDPTHWRSMQMPWYFSRVSATDYCILVKFQFSNLLCPETFSDIAQTHMLPSHSS